MKEWLQQPPVNHVLVLTSEGLLEESMPGSAPAAAVNVYGAGELALKAELVLDFVVVKT